MRASETYWLRLVQALAVVLAAVAAAPSGAEDQTAHETAGIPLASAQPAVSREVILDSTLYGELKGKDTKLPSNACGPSSAANGLKYLQNEWQEVYATEGHKLIPAPGYDGLVAVANILMGPMKTGSNGTLARDWIDGVFSYVEGIVPGKTVYSAQEPSKSSSWERPAWVARSMPTFDFIFSALQCRSMVGILLMRRSGRLHFVAVHGVSWSDADKDGLIDKSEKAMIYMVDSSLKHHENAGPGPVMLAKNQIWQETDGGRIECDYGGLAEIWIGAALALRPLSPPEAPH